VTVPLRDGDPRFTDAKTYRISLPGWEIETGGDHHAFGLRGDARDTTPRNAPLGYEVNVLQSGRLLARLRLAGVCNSFACAMRTIKGPAALIPPWVDIGTSAAPAGMPGTGE
jgi:hypothetical protein